MNIGDTIITKGGLRYSIDNFITIKNKPAIVLKIINGSEGNLKVMKDYMNFYLGTGIYEIKRKKIKKLFRRRLNKTKGKRS